MESILPTRYLKFFLVVEINASEVGEEGHFSHFFCWRVWEVGELPKTKTEIEKVTRKVTQNKNLKVPSALTSPRVLELASASDKKIISAIFLNS